MNIAEASCRPYKIIYAWNEPNAFVVNTCIVLSVTVQCLYFSMLSFHFDFLGKCFKGGIKLRIYKNLLVDGMTCQPFFYLHSGNI